MELYGYVQNKIEQICIELQDALQGKIKKEHYKTGRLFNSISVLPIRNADGNFTIRLTTLKYLEYLEHRDFFERFINEYQPKIKKLIALAAKQDIIELFRKAKTSSIYP